MYISERTPAHRSQLLSAAGGLFPVAAVIGSEFAYLSWFVVVVNGRLTRFGGEPRESVVDDFALDAVPLGTFGLCDAIFVRDRSCESLCRFLPINVVKHYSEILNRDIPLPPLRITSKRF